MQKFAVVANAVRGLSIDAVEKANSGHPGAPMGMAEMAAVLWGAHLRVNPNNPHWQNRDRFILSNGHASMLQYAMLHLSGFAVSLEDIQSFRQLHSHTPGHPEVGETAGVEITTGPLGQGIATAVGFALAEAHLAAKFNREGFNLVNHFTYCFLGDGCLMEGVAHEACSLAGTFGLGKLIALYDSNGISIDGEVEQWFDENVKQRFEAYGWQVIDGIDGHDMAAIDQAITAAKAETGKPSLLICRTTIGYGSPKLAGSEKSHGAPLGAEEVLATKAQLGLAAEAFSVDSRAYEVADLRVKGAQFEADWQKIWCAYQEAFPEQAKRYQQVMQGELAEDFEAVYQQALADAREKNETIATRKASENAINALASVVPDWLGGSADLTGSNNTRHKHAKALTKANYAGDYVHYGVREFAMATIMNGMCLHGGVRPFGGTFLVFSDYMRNAIRLSALMKLPVTYVLTHDSIGLGEDGPTHQPIEHLASLRLIPNLAVWRPCDSVETLVAWRWALTNAQTPTALALSRQNLPAQARNDAQVEAIARGGYELIGDTEAVITLLATGSEVALAVEALTALKAAGIVARVVSMPCVEVFLAQEAAYQAQVLPDALPILAIEAGSALFWRSFTGRSGDVIGMETFGASAPAGQLFTEFGFTVENIVSRAKALL